MRWLGGPLCLTLALLAGCEDDLGDYSSARSDGAVDGADADPLGGRPDTNFPDTSLADADLADAYLSDAGLADAERPDPADADLSDADTSDAAPLDPPDAGPAPSGDVLYPADRTLSPLTPDLVEALRDLIADGPARQDQVFAKVGASATVSVHNMQCFAGDRIDLDGRDSLWPTIDHFLDGDAAGGDPYTRDSLTATVGWSARSAVAGDPSPVEQEISAISPRFALVMYGTNDIQSRNPDRYADSMLTLVDVLMAEGVIPVLTTVMPRDDDPEADALVPQYNTIVRGVAQGRGVPLADFHRELLPLPDHGLGGDDLHPSVYRDGGARACDFTDEGLRYGYNIRNLLMIESLDRLRRAVLDGGAAPDPLAVPRLAGAGLAANPYRVDALPFTDLKDTFAHGEARIDRYTGCDAPQDESGPEVVYRLDLDRETTLRAMVFDRGEVDVDLHLLDASGEAAGCLERDHQLIEASLAPGTWYLVVDSYVSGGEIKGGEYLLTVIEE